MTPGAGNLLGDNEADHWKFYMISKSRKETDISFGHISNLFFITPGERISEALDSVVFFCQDQGRKH